MARTSYAVYVTKNGFTAYHGAHLRQDHAEYYANYYTDHGYALDSEEGWIQADRAYVVASDENGITIIESATLPMDDPRIVFVTA